MRRLFALTGVVLIALVGAGSAQALSEPQSTLLRSLSQAELKALIHDIDAQGLQTSGSSNVKTGMTRMQIAAGRLANPRLLGTIGVAATGSVVVWKIADSLGLGGYVYKKITGTDTATYSTATNMRWHCIGGGACPSASITAGAVTWNDGWRFRSDQANQINWTDAVGGAGATTTGPPSPGACGNPTTAAAELCAAAVAMGTSTTWMNVTAGATYYVLRTDAQMENTLQMEPSDAAEFASPPGGATTATAGTNDTSTLTDPELEAALDRIDPSPGTTGSAVEQETAEAILDELDPGWDNEFITLLQPQVNETYTEYITRLQADGWLGDATSTELATENSAYGPEAVVRITYTPAGTTTAKTLAPLAWPTTAPQIELNDDIAIRYNPATAAPAPTEGTGTDVTVNLPPTTVPTAPAVDFGPITGLDPGCKFPYGFICYAVDFTEQFDVAADAPVFSFDIDIADFGGIDAGQYTVDLEVMDDYMALWRGILTVVLWVGAIFFVATRMLGVKFGGDPGEAIDDVL